MNLEERRKELEKHIKYIEMVLGEKKDELFCLNVEIKQQKEKGAQSPLIYKLILERRYSFFRWIHI